MYEILGEVNMSKLGDHLLINCAGVDCDTKAPIIDSSQVGKKAQMVEPLTSNALSFSSETLVNVHEWTMASEMADMHLNRTKQTSMLCRSSDGRV